MYCNFIIAEGEPSTGVSRKVCVNCGYVTPSNFSTPDNVKALCKASKETAREGDVAAPPGDFVSCCDPPSTSHKT